MNRDPRERLKLYGILLAVVALLALSIYLNVVEWT